MTQIYRELRENLRVFRRQPGFSLIVVLTIALGIVALIGIAIGTIAALAAGRLVAA